MVIHSISFKGAQLLYLMTKINPVLEKHLKGPVMIYSIVMFFTTYYTQNIWTELEVKCLQCHAPVSTQNCL